MGNTIMVHKQPIGPPKSVGGHADADAGVVVVAVIVVGYLVSFSKPFSCFLPSVICCCCCESFLMNAVLNLVLYRPVFLLPITPSSLFGELLFLSPVFHTNDAF